MVISGVEEEISGKGRALTLHQLQDISRTMEASEQQASNI